MKSKIEVSLKHIKMAEDDEVHCSIEGCECVYPDDDTRYYGFCYYCEDFGICYKGDQEHGMAILYNESCNESHEPAVCVSCALEAYKKYVNNIFVPGEEHCFCPVCNYDYGLLVDIVYTKNT